MTGSRGEQTYAPLHEDYGPLRTGPVGGSRGPRMADPGNESIGVARLTAENARLTAELAKTTAVLDVVGKRHALFETLSEGADRTRIARRPKTSTVNQLTTLGTKASLWTTVRWRGAGRGG